MRRSRTLSGASNVLAHLLPKPYSLESLSEPALRQLATLLAMDPHAGLEAPSGAWLLSQHRRIPVLDPQLRRPSGVLNQIALSAAAHKLPSFAPCAALCASHEGLDPRIIRELLYRVGQECTVRVDRYRRYQGGRELDVALLAWLDRMDAMTALWLRKETFESALGYPVETPKRRIACEACVLAVIGGTAQMVSDLRLSLVVRHTAKSTHHRPREPRLLPVVEKWAAGLGVSTWERVQDAEEVMVPLILAAREVVLRERDDENRRRRAMGKRPRRRVHAELVTKEGLPMPRIRQEGERKQRNLPSGVGGLVNKQGGLPSGVDGLAAMSGALRTVDELAETDVFGDGRAVDDGEHAQEDDAYDDQSAVHDGVFDDANALVEKNMRAEDEEPEQQGEDESIWTRQAQDQLQQQQGERVCALPDPTTALPSELVNAFATNHNNATFESFGAASAVPPPLRVNPGHIARRNSALSPPSAPPPSVGSRISLRSRDQRSLRAPSVAASRVTRATSRYSRYSWTDVSVYSLDSGDDSDAPPPTIPQRSSRRLCARRKSAADCTYSELAPRRPASSVYSGGGRVPLMRRRAPSVRQVLPYLNRDSPASSVYSETGVPPPSSTPSVATAELPRAAQGPMLRERRGRRDKSRGSSRQGSPEPTRGSQARNRNRKGKGRMPMSNGKVLARLERKAMTSESLLGLGAKSASVEQGSWI